MYKLPALLLLLLCAFTAKGQQTWKLSTETDGMKVYTAGVTNSKLKAVKVECDFNVPLSQLTAVLLDIKASPDWVYATKSCTLIKQVSPTELYYYSEVNIPWPAQNRDFVAHLMLTQNADTKVVTIDGPVVTGMVPLKKGIVRIEHSVGKWVISPLGDNRVHVVYTLQVDPGGSIPSWLVNMFATDGPVQIFKKLRLQLQKPAYKDAKLVFIKD